MKNVLFLLGISFVTYTQDMRVLIIGNGGREHALAWKVAQSPLVKQIFVAPGNGGTATTDKTCNVAIKVTDIQQLVHFALHNKIDLTIVGPEVALEAGIVDAFESAGLRIFGPIKAAAQLETSKVFAKEFMKRHNLPTANYAVFTDIENAITYINKQPLPLVIKADGLCAGKGVIIAHTYDQARVAAFFMLSGKAFGNAGKKIIVEEFLEGEEVTFIVMTDGHHCIPLATAQDHKKRDNGDKGPNTGGMGAYSPAPLVTPQLHNRIMQEIIEPTIRGMAQDGTPYVGFLYAGLMISPADNPYVLEFNARLGDPEAQVILLRLQTDLFTLCNAVLDKQLHTMQAYWDPRAALCVVLTAGGYPEKYTIGDEIFGLEHSPLTIFHASSVYKNNKFFTAGGRVLNVCALGNTVSEAQKIIYNNLTVNWPGMYYRTDIGYKAKQ
jgi:phosphoribosylamine--glycine ligase